MTPAESEFFAKLEEAATLAADLEWQLGELVKRAKQTGRDALAARIAELRAAVKPVDMSLGQLTVLKSVRARCG